MAMARIYLHYGEPRGRVMVNPDLVRLNAETLQWAILAIHLASSERQPQVSTSYSPSIFQISDVHTQNSCMPKTSER